MKTKDLIAELKRCEEKYGPDFLEWEVYIEQCDEQDKKYKREGGQKGWGIVKDITDDWEYFECAGFWTQMPVEKIFTINVNY